MKKFSLAREAHFVGIAVNYHFMYKCPLFSKDETVVQGVVKKAYFLGITAYADGKWGCYGH